MALGRTVGELLSSLSSQELAEWQAYENLEPFGERRADLRMVRLCDTIARCAGNRDFDPSIFLYDFERPWKKVQGKDLDAQKRQIAMSLPSPKYGSIVCYEGDAPPIKRIGKRGKITPEKRRLQEILRGQSR